MDEKIDIGGLLEIEKKDSVALVRMVRTEARNALSMAMMEALRDTGRELARDPRLAAVILTGADDYFSAGADLKDPALDARRKLPLLEMREAMKIGPDLCKAWEDIEAVTIAAIEGYCVGGAVALAASCDFRIAGKGTQMRLPEVPLGMNMSWQSVPRLVALIGPANTKMFTLFGEMVDADEALRWGLVDKVVGSGEALGAARVLADKAAALPPIAARMAKQGINKAALALADATSFMDSDQYILATGSEDFKESIRAFRDKREPSFKGN